MGRPALELSGLRVGILSVKNRVYQEDNQNSYWLCICDCGNEKILSGSQLKSGKAKSCGCSKNVFISEKNSTHGATKGAGSTKEYRAWQSMLRRTSNTTDKFWSDYGGRGIQVCQRWLDSYENFLADVGEAPSAYHSLDRINVDGNYEPSNVRWATSKEQARNTRSNRLIEYNGKMLPVAEVVELLGVDNPSLVEKRLYKGWTIEDAVTRPFRSRK